MLLTRLDDGFWEPIRHENLLPLLVLLLLLPRKKGYCNVCYRRDKKYFQCKNHQPFSTAVKLVPNDGNNFYGREGNVTARFPQCRKRFVLIRTLRFLVPWQHRSFPFLLPATEKKRSRLQFGVFLNYTNSGSDTLQIWLILWGVFSLYKVQETQF